MCMKCFFHCPALSIRGQISTELVNGTVASVQHGCCLIGNVTVRL